MAVLEGFGLHELIWDAVDGPFGGALVASPADAGGRGIALHVRQDGAEADLSGAEVYLAWRHRVTGARGTEPFDEVDAEAGAFCVFYPAAMVAAEGAVDAQVVVSRGNGTYISSRVFQVRVEPVVIGGAESEDGFTTFLEALSAYEDAAAALEEAEAALSDALAALETAAGGGYITSAVAVTLEAGEEATAEVVDGTLTIGVPAGYTPVRGTDYWTEEDVAEIEAYVVAYVEEVENGAY